jgi:hypothetical protein
MSAEQRYPEVLPLIYEAIASAFYPAKRWLLSRPML